MESDKISKPDTKIVILGNISKNQLDYYKWKDIIDKGIAVYIPGVIIKNGFWKIWMIIRKHLFSINLTKTLPFLKSIQNAIENSVYKTLFTMDVPKDTDLLIVSHNSLFNMGKYKLRKVKKRGCKIVLFLYDSIPCLAVDYRNAVFDCCSSGLVDKTYSFDISDCQAYKFIYWEQIYSPVQLINDSVPLYDIYFAGRDKGRLNQILSCLSKFREANLRCLVRMPEMTELQNSQLATLMGEGFKSEMLAYDESLREMLQSACILDIVSEKQSGISWRIVEALYYNKKLLTNNKSVLVSKYYTPNYIQYFENIEDINIDWIKNKVAVDFKYKNDYSAIEFIHKVKDDLRCC